MPNETEILAKDYALDLMQTDALDVDGANPTNYALVCTAFTGTSSINGAFSLREIY